MIQKTSQEEAVIRKYQHEALLILRLNCETQGDLKTSSKESKVKNV